jgi:hypothetical protein
MLPSTPPRIPSTVLDELPFFDDLALVSLPKNQVRCPFRIHTGAGGDFRCLCISSGAGSSWCRDGGGGDLRCISRSSWCRNGGGGRHLCISSGAGNCLNEIQLKDMEFHTAAPFNVRLEN